MHGGADEGGEQSDRQELALWKRLRTGARSDYDSVKRDHRGYPIFVKATQLSDNWDQFRDAEKGGEEENFIVGNNRGINTTVNDDSADFFDGLSVENSAPINNEVGRGKAVASFYSQLPRDTLTEERRSQSASSATPLPFDTTPAPSKFAQKGSTDWFIRKASAQLQLKKVESQQGQSNFEYSSLPVINNDSTNRCELCLTILPFPLTSIQWEAHRHSIAHQLAIESPKLPSSLLSNKPPSTKRKSHEKGSNDEDGRSARIILKTSNIGYAALERMGWRKGMGLGREEWEYGLRSRRKPKKDDRGGKDHAIVISDSDDEYDTGELDIGSEAWLAAIQASQARLDQCNRLDSLDNKLIEEQSQEKEEDEEDEEDKDVDEQAPPKQRPLLEPITIHLRPDRRGIGNHLPASSRVADDKMARQRVVDGNTAMQHRSTKRTTKREKKEMENRKRQEWKELRMSLN